MLIGLCLVGVILAAVQTRTARGEEAISGILGMAVCFGLLDLLVGIALTRPIWRYFLGGQQTFTVARVFGVVALLLGMIMAIFVFFFTVCLFLWEGK